MKTRIHIFVFVFLWMSVSCQVRELTVGDDSKTTFYASGESGTRTQLEGEGKPGEWMNRINWSPSDEIKVYCKGVDGKFISTNTEATGGTVAFVGSLPVRDRGDHPYWAVYPYSENSLLDGSGVELTLPSTQEAVAGNVQKGLMASVACSDNYNLYFRHLFGVIRIGVFEEGIKKIVFKGNNGESVAGRIRATLDEQGIPFISEIKNASQEIILLPPEGESFKTTTSYFIVCLPGAFEKGYTIELYRDELVSMKKIDTPVVLNRGHMVQMFDLYSGGIIYSTEYNGKTYSLRYKVNPNTHWGTATYWLTIDDKVIDIPEEFSIFQRESPTMAGPAVAIDPETETIFFAKNTGEYERKPKGVVYRIDSSGYDKAEVQVGYYPGFQFDEGQKRLEIHSYSSLGSAHSCYHYVSYHEADNEWVKERLGFYEDVEYESSGYNTKLLSDVILFFHEAENQPMNTVNLGLSVIWADRNLGAGAQERFGDYYAWGETSKKSVYSWENYKYYDGEYHCWDRPARSVVIEGNYFAVPVFTKYNHKDKKTYLDLEDDVAHAQLDDHWRLPTPEEWQELMDNCSWEWTTINGVAGQRGTSLKNGATIFLPAASLREYDYFDAFSTGSYQSSYTDQDWRSSNQNFSSFFIGQDAFYFDESGMSIGYEHRWKGLPIRPVYGFVALEDVVFDKTYVELIPGESTTLDAEVIPANATHRTLVWSSSNEAVVTVSQTGEIHAISEGTAIITVTVQEEGRSASCEVAVKYGSSFIDIPEMVDMGLSVKWASFNVGASRPEDVGYYFAWGEVRPKEDYGNDTYKWCVDGSFSDFTKYCHQSQYGHNGFTDYKMVLDREDDAAYVYYGGKWRMPTDKELEELCSNSSVAWAKLNGVDGIWVTSLINGNRFFIPCTGYKEYDGLYVTEEGFHWSSSLWKDSAIEASCLGFYSWFGSPIMTCNTIFRELGLPVRAVYGDPAPPGGNEDITPGGEINM